MPLSFPLSTPATTRTTSRVKFAMVNQVSMSRSPFSGVRQAQEWPGEWWEADVTLAPMKRADAAQWIALLSALRGQSGTMYFGDPNGKTPQGLASRMSVNLLTWSEAFDNAVWTKDGSSTVTANNVTDPNGGSTADTLTKGAGPFTDFSEIYEKVASTAYVGQKITFSVWLKVASGTASVTIAAGDYLTSNTFLGITVTSSWQRFTVTSPALTSTGFITGGFTDNRASGSLLQVWGAQLESGSSASAYIGSTSGSVVMNGTVQGPKFILLRGFPPNTLVLNAGDWLSPGAGVGATRIKTSGGSVTDKYFYTPGTSVNGQRYIFSMRLKNIGQKTVQVTSDIAVAAVNVPAGTEAQVLYFGNGNGTNAAVMNIVALAAGDSLDMIAWAPRIQRQGLDENLIPLANQNFSGWTADSGATITLTQSYNQRLYQAQSDVTSDASGNAGVEIFPRWRTGDAVADGDPVTINSAKGVFFLADNRREWDLDNAMNYGLSMKLIESF